MDMTSKLCPYCGEDLTSVEYDNPRAPRTELGEFTVYCGQGHGSIVLWPDSDHDEDCECSKHDCVVCGNTTHNADQVCDKKDCQDENGN